MLKNELIVVRELRGRILQGDKTISSEVILDTFHKVRIAWENAAFSTSDELCLKRYFYFHLEGIRDILDALPFGKYPDKTKDTFGEELISLIYFLRQYFGVYFNTAAVAPGAFASDVRMKNSAALDRIRTFLGQTDDPALKTCLFNYFEQMDMQAGKNYTYHALFYFDTLVSELETVSRNEAPNRLAAAIALKLAEMDFNRLDYFCYQKNAFQRKLPALPVIKQIEILTAELRTLSVLPQCPDRCDPRWPSLREMLSGWLGEELALIRSESEAGAKLSLNLSVAHLACLTRLFFEENIYDSETVTAVFKFISGHFQTKRQNRISIGSLSKQYYSFDQVAAAVIRDKLLKMVSRLNREYFPAMVVTGAAVLLYSAVR